MDPIDKLQSSYRVEVSGWDAAEKFFVEKTMLDWHGGEQKEINLQVSLREGCVLFVRLLQPTAVLKSIPIAYEAAKLTKKDAHGGTRVCLAQITPGDKRETTDGWSAPRTTA
jgi:hypothetical protein